MPRYVVVGQHHRRAVQGEGGLHNQPGVHRRGVDIALGDSANAQHLPLAVHAQQIHHLIARPEEIGVEQLVAFLGGGGQCPVRWCVPPGSGWTAPSLF